jgi:tRNA nucleotidyltransferase/poly(A) polymerase
MDSSKCWYVGGSVRDYFYNSTRGVLDKKRLKDIDITCECDYREMQKFVSNVLGGTIVQEDVKFGRLRAGIPVKNLPEDVIITSYLQGEGMQYSASSKKLIYIDFVVSRSDGLYTDGRHPDSISLSSIEEDLGRRDFTMNAIALNMGNAGILDPYRGREAIASCAIRFVGNPLDRILEDFLRVLRAYRFSITLSKGFETVFSLSNETKSVIKENERVISRGLLSISNERIYEELYKMFSYNNTDSFRLIAAMPPLISEVILFNNADINLIPRMKKAG